MTFPRSFQAPPQAKLQLFTAGGLFYLDPTATWVYVEGVGAGASGQSAYGGPAQGGNGGLWDWALIPASSITAPVQVTVGAGGVSNGTNFSPIVPGGDSKFGNFLTCKGGNNGTYTDAVGGSGTGTAGAVGGSSLRGGGAGGGAGSSSGSAGGTSLRGGNGGTGVYGGTAGNGVAPGGGGGANSNGIPGNGASGQMRVYWW